MDGIVETSLDGLEFVSRGKVRDIYKYGPHYLFVVTDRISAFDVVLPTPIPDKGKVLHQISSFWFQWCKPIVGNHNVADRIADFPADLQKYRAVLAGRSALVRKAQMFPVECVARGYLSGSGWKEYRQSGTVCGIELPAGLVESGQLREPIFTPATKESSGHDINISFAQMVDILGAETSRRLRDLTLEIYSKAAAYAQSRGIIIADTKFEFGMIDGQIVICDEMLTPDSSRFWPSDRYRPGGSPPSFDKQFMRDWLESTGWDKNPPAPTPPHEVIAGTRERYLEALQRITGHGLQD